MSLLTFFQDEIENLWKHAVKISLGPCQLLSGFAFGNWFAESLRKCFTILATLTVPRIRVPNVRGPDDPNMIYLIIIY